MSDGCSCGCCAGVAARTPLEAGNRPGLSAIAYRAGTHAEFLASMIAGLTDIDRPGLAKLGTRDRDDFTIALLDAWAVAADVLAFYTERLAQESYLRTARERISLQELGRLIGYRLRPGVAAETCLAFALEPPPDVPAAASADPGSAPPVTPATVTLEPGLRVQSIPGPGEAPQTFETVEQIEARPEWNAIPARTTLAIVPGVRRQARLPAGSGAQREGRRPAPAGRRGRARRALGRAHAHRRHRRRGERPHPCRLGRGARLGQPAHRPATVPQPYVFRKRIGIFGATAPQWGAMSLDFRNNYPGGLGKDQWPNFTSRRAPRPTRSTSTARIPMSSPAHGSCSRSRATASFGRSRR